MNEELVSKSDQLSKVGSVAKLPRKMRSRTDIHGHKAAVDGYIGPRAERPKSYADRVIITALTLTISRKSRSTGHKVATDHSFTQLHCTTSCLFLFN